MRPDNPPGPISDLSILQKTADAYIIWHKNSGNLSRFSRVTIGIKIDSLFTELLEFLLRAGYASSKQKLSLTEDASVKLDSLKYFLHLMHEANELPDKKYIEISTALHETGKMLGSWRKYLLKSTGASWS